MPLLRPRKRRVHFLEPSGMESPATRYLMWMDYHERLSGGYDARHRGVQRERLVSRRLGLVSGKRLGIDDQLRYTRCGGGYFYDYTRYLCLMTLVFAKDRSMVVLKDALMNARTIACFADTLAGRKEYVEAFFKQSMPSKYTRMEDRERSLPRSRRDA